MSSWFMGIDQSYSGLAVVMTDGDQVYDSLRKYPAEKFGKGASRLAAIKEGFLETLDNRPASASDIEHICLEGYAMGTKFGREQAGELGGTLKLALWEWGQRAPVIVSPTAVKKFAVGKGNNVSKSQMLLSVYKKWGIEYSNDNLADAYTLSRVALALSSEKESLLAYEREVLAQLKV